MHKHLHIKRLSLAIRELWQMNRLLIVSIPFVMLLSFALYYLWPDSVFYNKLFAPDNFPTPDSWIQTLLSKNFGEKVFILVLVPLYLVLCTKPYFDKLNKSERANLMPITHIERTITLTLYGIGIACFTFACFVLYDYVLTSWFRSLYYEDTIAYLERQGDLYPTLYQNSIFFTIPFSKVIVGFFIIILLLLPLYFLSLVFFKKYSFLLFIGVLSGIIVFIVFVLRKWLMSIESPGVLVPLEETLPQILHILLVFVYWSLALGTFYYKLKEKEI